MNLNETMTKLAENKAKMKELNGQLKELKKEHDEIEGEIIMYLKESKLDRVSSAGFTASHTTEEVCSVFNWEDFFEYVRENNAFYLLQKRTSSAAYRELLQVEGEAARPPGTESMVKDKLSFTKSTR